MSLKTKGLIFISLKKEEKKMFCHVSIANDVDKLRDKVMLPSNSAKIVLRPEYKILYPVLCKNLQVLCVREQNLKLLHAKYYL